MERLHNVLRGKAKRSIMAIGLNGMFYATALKCLKKEFGNPNVVSHIKLNDLFNQPQIKEYDCNAIKHYHQKLKCTATWLASMGYHTSLYSIDNISKAVQLLPNSMRQSFYRFSKDLLETEVLSLIEFERWLDSKIKELFNPIPI